MVGGGGGGRFSLGAPFPYAARPAGNQENGGRRPSNSTASGSPTDLSYRRRNGGRSAGFPAAGSARKFPVACGTAGPAAAASPNDPAKRELTPGAGHQKRHRTNGRSSRAFSRLRDDISTTPPDGSPTVRGALNRTDPSRLRGWAVCVCACAGGWLVGWAGVCVCVGWGVRRISEDQPGLRVDIALSQSNRPDGGPAISQDF